MPGRFSCIPQETNIYPQGSLFAILVNIWGEVPKSKLLQSQAQSPLNCVAISTVNAMLMQYHGWQWKHSPVRIFKFMTSVTVLTSPTLVSSGSYVIVLPGKFMHLDVYGGWIMVTLRIFVLCFLTSVCSKGQAFKNGPQKSTPDCPMLCKFPCLGMGSRDLKGPQGLDHLWICFQVHRSQKQREIIKVGVGMVQVNAQSRWHMRGYGKEKECGLIVAVIMAIMNWALIPCQELF